MKVAAPQFLAGFDGVFASHVSTIVWDLLPAGNGGGGGFHGVWELVRRGFVSLPARNPCRV